MPDLSTLLPLIGINALLAWSMWVPLSVGRIWFGTAGIAALGAYTVGWMSVHDVESTWVMLASAAVVGAVAMAVCGVLALRLTGFAFGLSSLAIAEVIRIWLNNVSSLGGAAGLSNVPVLDNVGTLGLVGIAVVLLFSWYLFRRPLGRECDAAATDELLARSVGARPGIVRLLPFAASGAAAGFAGGLITCHTGYIEPAMFGLPLSIEIFSYVIIGGVASFVGPVVGAAGLTVLIEAMASIGDLREVFFGGLIVVIMLVRRDGFVPRLKVLQVRRLRRALRAVGRLEEAAEPEDAGATQIAALAHEPR